MFGAKNFGAKIIWRHVNVEIWKIKLNLSILILQIALQQNVRKIWDLCLKSIDVHPTTFSRTSMYPRTRNWLKSNACTVDYCVCACLHFVHTYIHDFFVSVEYVLAHIILNISTKKTKQNSLRIYFIYKTIVIFLQPAPTFNNNYTFFTISLFVSKIWIICQVNKADTFQFCATQWVISCVWLFSMLEV